MKDNALIPKHVDEMHPRFTSNLETAGWDAGDQNLAGDQKAESWRDSSAQQFASLS